MVVHASASTCAFVHVCDVFISMQTSRNVVLACIYLLYIILYAFKRIPVFLDLLCDSLSDRLLMIFIVCTVVFMKSSRPLYVHIE